MEVFGPFGEIVNVIKEAGYMPLEYVPEADVAKNGKHLLYVVPDGLQKILGSVLVVKDKELSEKAREGLQAWLRKLPEIDEEIERRLREYQSMIARIKLQA